MEKVKTFAPGLLLCLAIALVSQWLGGYLPVVGGPVFAILIGMFLHLQWRPDQRFDQGIAFSSKKVLQYAVILLGFGLNLQVVMEIGLTSLPIILSTILTSLVVAYLVSKWLHVPVNSATLIGVGSSICGGSAIAATAPVIDAKDEEVAQAISVIFLFNVLAAILFPTLGTWLGFSQTSGEAFGLFAGTAINDTSSVTAAASIWDNLYGLGTATLDQAVTVKLTRTLAIIPITLGLAVYRSRKDKQQQRFTLKKVFPTFILFFLAASCLTTIVTSLGLSADIFTPLKSLSKFFIMMAMAGIGLKTNLVSLIKNSRKAIFLGLACWVSITLVSLALQYFLGFIG